MIAAIAERVLSEYERRTTSPVMVKRAATIVEKLLKPDGNASMVHEIQRRRLRFAMLYAYQRSPFYRESFDRAGVCTTDVCTIEDLRKLPFTTSNDILDWKRFLCAPEDELAAVFTTSGTTGEPKRVYYSFGDMQVLVNFEALALRLVHPGRLAVLVALPMRHGFWMGAASAQRVVERAGGLPLPVGADDPQETLTWMKRFEPNVVMSSPSCMTALTREAERSGYRRRLDAVLLGGETLLESQKVYFRDNWGAQVFDSYGSTEIGGAQTIVFPGCIAFHLNDMHLVTEIIHPETGEPAQEGELVFTTLAREAMPLVRYRSGDLARWSGCPCRSSFSAIQLMGRNDDMLVAGDMNLYGHILAEAVAKVPGTSGRVTIVLEKVALTDRLIVRVEGDDVSGEVLKRSLFTAYPELRTNTLNGNLIMEIETGVDLGRQIKALKMVDKREQQQKFSRRIRSGIELIQGDDKMEQLKRFDYTVETARHLDETVTAIEAKAQEKGFRVLYIHDVQATLAAKGFTIEPMKIIEICNAKFASQILAKDKKISLMLPCPISVFVEEGKTYISAFKPRALSDYYPGLGIEEIAEEVEKIVINLVEETR